MRFDKNSQELKRICYWKINETSAHNTHNLAVHYQVSSLSYFLAYSLDLVYFCLLFKNQTTNRPGEVEKMSSTYKILPIDKDNEAHSFTELFEIVFTYISG